MNTPKKLGPLLTTFVHLHHIQTVHVHIPATVYGKQERQAVLPHRMYALQPSLHHTFTCVHVKVGTYYKDLIWSHVHFEGKGWFKTLSCSMSTCGIVNGFIIMEITCNMKALYALTITEACKYMYMYSHEQDC